MEQLAVESALISWSLLPSQLFPLRLGGQIAAEAVLKLQQLGGHQGVKTNVGGSEAVNFPVAFAKLDQGDRRSACI